MQQNVNFSARTVAEGENLKPTFLRVHERALMDDENQRESLLHPFQEIEHHCKSNLTPTYHKDTNDNMRDPKLLVEDKDVSFNSDGRKIFQTIGKPTESEL